MTSLRNLCDLGGSAVNQSAKQTNAETREYAEVTQRVEIWQLVLNQCLAIGTLDELFEAGLLFQSPMPIQTWPIQF